MGVQCTEIFLQSSEVNMEKSQKAFVPSSLKDRGISSVWYQKMFFEVSGTNFKTAVKSFKEAFST